MSLMRAPKTEATGTSGQSAVKSQFEALQWGAVSNPEHDLGTDLWLMARDVRRFDLGALVGVQVKTGDSYFSEPEKNADGAIEGWWHREDKRHFEYWTGHRVPHLLVLHDENSRTSYWVHVTEDAVVSTGKQSKILVSSESIVSSEHLDSLLRVATSRPNVKEWEGSAWQLGHQIPLSSQLRYALITPRLVAPHPNYSVASISGPEAIALLVQMRLSDIGRYLDKEPRLQPATAATAEDAVWQLYSSLYQWIEKGVMGPLKLLLGKEGCSDSDRVAITVAVANAMYEDGHPREALDVIDSLIEEDVASPVDDGWLRVQRIRCLVDIGELKTAREEALRVQSLRHVAPDDPTARAISGAAAHVVLNLGDLTEGNIAGVIQNGDNLASWWRSQAFVTALSKQLDENFKSWGKDTSVTIGADDMVGNRLRSTMLIAGFMADNSAWRTSVALLSQQRLMEVTSSDSEIAVALGRLVRAGADKEVKLVSNRLASLGPVSPLSEVANSVELPALTRMSLKSTLVLLRCASDVLSREMSDSFARWALDILSGRADLGKRLHPSFLLLDEVAFTLASVIRGLSVGMRQKVMEFIVSLPTVDDQMIAGRYADIVRNIDQNLWSEQDVEALTSRTDGDHFEFCDSIDKLVAARRPEHRQSLVERIRDGDYAALVSYGKVTELPQADAASMMAHLARRVDEQTQAAKRQSYGFGTQDPLAALVLLNVWFPDEAIWQVCLEALEEERSHGDHIIGGIEKIGSSADRIPADIREKLRVPLERISERIPNREGVPDLFSGRSDPRGAADFAISRLYPEHFTDAKLAELVCGSSKQRIAAAEIVGLREEAHHLPLLSSLSVDGDVGVRRVVAYYLARWIIRGVVGAPAVGILKLVLNTNGVRVASAAANALLEDSESTYRGTLVELLKEVPSVRVRAILEDLN